MERCLLLMAVVPALMLTIACSSGGDTVPIPTPTIAPPPTTVTALSPSPSPANGESILIEVQANSNPYIFSPATLELEAGVPYRFLITGDAEFHTFTANDLGINVNLLANTSETIEFVANQPGTYHLICIPHELQGMTGTIKVR